LQALQKATFAPIWFQYGVVVYVFTLSAGTPGCALTMLTMIIRLILAEIWRLIGWK